MQLNLVFSESIPFQNNRESQMQVEEYLSHFTGQNLTVFNHMMNGGKINSLMASAQFSIVDLRARIHAIKNAGFEYSYNKIVGANGMKEYFMTTEQIENNKNRIKNG